MSPGKSEVHVEMQQPMQGAELSALLENQRLIEERMKKEVSMAQFKAKTTTNAQKVLKDKIKSEKMEKDQKLLEKRDMLLKTREFAAQSRALAVKKAQVKKAKDA